MANTSRIGGFKPVYHLNGSPYNGQATRYYVPSSDSSGNIFIGDVVKLAAGGADAEGYVPMCTLAAAGDAVIGVVVAVERNPDNLTVTGTYRADDTERYLWVADAVDLVFEAEVSNGTMAAADVGLNVNHAVGTGSTTMARSGAYIDKGTDDTSATLTFKVKRVVPRPDNEVGASNKVHVSINNHQFGSSTGTAGV